ncbi:AAA family ATPase [Vibrio genomosp. F10]|uniref:AAA family ATPase n=1 Tax=Vibrio genomosp. F10 TaxID=723171 RepID=UPI00031CCE5D|nr:AAA family ATPase [Vibrio genomosp. F10]OEE84641.1 hypothetical protein A1QK_03945 [Vibrio genomosp. F10 str. 9ZD137]OEF06027.1 hypothetical protein A1QI_07080 [Vibrio genomosp. F10 str. 9ZB36]
MANSNFSFIDSEYPKLSKLGKQAEANIHCDPQTAAFKLRAYSELLVGYIYHHLQIDQSVDSLLERLQNQTFRHAVPQEIQGKLHAIRKQGNKAVHNELELTVEDALWLLEEAYLVGRWFIQTMQGSYVFVPSFTTPESNDDALNNLRLNNKKLLVEAGERASVIKQTERELEEIKKELEQSRAVQLSLAEAEESIRQFQRSGKDAANSFNLKMEETRSRVSITEEFSDIKLTVDQQRALSSIDQFIRTSDLDAFLLHGYAGTGKTFITKGIVSYLNNLGRHCVLLSPTGKAAKVLTEKTGQSASTIHSEIYDFRDAHLKDENDDRLPVAPVKQNFDSEETIYIVDEASMVSDSYSFTESLQFGSGYLLKDLVDYSKKSIENTNSNTRRKIIFIGDHAQLPPVGMKISPALSSEYLVEHHHLKLVEETLREVVRQKSSSGVLENATTLRNAIESDVFNQLNFVSEQADVESIQSSEIIDRYMHLCEGKIAKTKEVMLVASSNRIVASYNLQCRQRFFPNQPEICVGDKVISVANHYRNDIDVTNGDFGLVTQVLPGIERKTVTFRKKVDGKTENVTVKLAFRDVELLFRNKANTPQRLRAKILENLLYNDEPSLSVDESRALNVDFLKRNSDLTRKGFEDQLKLARKSDEYLNAFKVKFGYAITCHKAQGSEWEHVLVNCNSHLNYLCKDYFRWLYTAITRTSKVLYVVDEPKIKLGGGSTIVGANILVKQTDVHDELEDLEVEELQRFDISTQEPLKIALLRKVKSCLKNSNVEILAIHHHNYQELYILNCGESNAEVQFVYNGKNRVSSVQVRGGSPIQEDLESRFSSIKGSIFSATSSTTTERESFDFDEEFLSDFYNRVCEVFKPHSIEIVNITQNPWNQRYTFSQNHETAVVDFYYNGKQQFKKVMPMPNLSSSKVLLNTVLEIWSHA